jgi:2-(1,2-epoxy-1,2-dihydrophenyl)acetyl-CoA isomerase
LSLNCDHSFILKKGGAVNMEYSTLLFDVSEGVAQITLNRPEALNSINLDIAKDLMYAILRCDEDPAIRAVMIKGAGTLFSAGGDLKAFSAQKKNLPHYVKEASTYFHAAISRMTRMDPPVIAAVHGYAMGAGMSLAIACDMVLAAETARFMLAYTRVGLTPDGSATYFLPRAIGLKRALDLALTNRMFSAREALEWGMVTRVVPEDELLLEARAIATQLAAGPTRTYGASKRLLYNGWTETLETQMEQESQSIANIARTDDVHEGINAFLEKRPPKFKGK